MSYASAAYRGGNSCIRSLDGNSELTKDKDAVESFLGAKGVIYAISDPNVPPTPLGMSAIAQQSDGSSEKTAGPHRGIKHVNLSADRVAEQDDWKKEFSTPKR